MKKLRVLIPVRRSPELGSTDLYSVKNILKSLEKSYSIEIFWIVTLPESNKKTYDDHLIFFQDFKNMDQILQKTKPDMVFIRSTLEPINFSLLLCSKKNNIPSITLFFRTRILSNSPNLRHTFSSNIRMAFSSKVKGDIEKTDVGKLKSSIFFINRFSFLLHSINPYISKFSLLLFFFKYIYNSIFNSNKIHKSIAGNLNLCKSNTDLKFLEKLGIEISTIKVVGSPAFDDLFSKIKSKKNHEKTQKIKILLITSSMHEHGFISRQKEFEHIKNIIRSVLSNKNYIINLKIHPTSSFLEEYYEELSEFRNQITIFQHDDLLDLIYQHDLMVLYGPTSAILYAIISKTPIIHVNFNSQNQFQMDPEFVNSICYSKNISSEISSCIDNLPPSSSKKYIENNLGIFDGNCSDRCSDEIIKILGKNV